MAGIEKFTLEAIENILKHNGRSAEFYSNIDIDSERTKLNYSFDCDHGKLSDLDYFRSLMDKNYIYGRGTKREKDAVVACGWIVTLPKEITGIREKEDRFFGGVNRFVANRYGEQNIINSSVHYDEGGQPHIHIVFVPVTELNHDKVQFKTVKSDKAVRMESGRYEYEYKYKLQDGTTIPVKDYHIVDGVDLRIPIKNYSKKSDEYDHKISGADVICKPELDHFHQDLAKYLSENGIEGEVINGKTGGINIPVTQLKAITKETGRTLDDIKKDYTLEELNRIIDSGKNKSITVKQIIERDRDARITVEKLQKELEVERRNNLSLREELHQTKYELMHSRFELARNQELIAQLEEKNRLYEMEAMSRDNSWETSVNSWSHDREEDKEW